MTRTGLVLVVLALCGACGDDDPEVAGGDASVSIADSSGSNVDTGLIAPTDIAVLSEDPLFVGILAFKPEGDFRRKEWQVTLALPGAAVEGDTHSIATDTSGAASLQLQETPGVGGVLREWGALDGTVAVDSVSGTTVTLSFGPSTMEPLSGGTGNMATGSFSFSGQLTIDDVTAVVQF